MSIRRKLILVWVGHTLALLLLLILANRFLVGRFYLDHKQKSIAIVYSRINALYNSDTASDIDLEIEKIYTTNNLNLAIFDEENSLVAASMFGNRSFGDRKLPRDLQDDGGAPIQQSPLPDNFGQDIARSWPWNVVGEVEQPERGKYKVFYVGDDRLGSNFINLYGVLDNGYSIFIRTPIDAINEAANLGGELLMYIGLVVLILGCITIFYLSHRMTKPIVELNGIAKKIAQLDFSQRYEQGGSDEIAALGESINTMSESLESTVMQLRESNAKLQEDIELKSKIDNMRREFIANASHELKTPVALISGYAEGLKMNIASDQEQREYYCDVIVDETERMDSIIRRMLDLMELESDDYTVEYNDFDLNSLIGSVIRKCGVLLERRGVAVDFNGDSEMLAHAEETSIMQVVTNYLTNAINHVDDKKIIRVSAKRKDAVIRVSVFNSGKNISDDDAERIWESFSKLDKAHTRSYGGTGLGLAIVKNIMQKHNRKYGLINREDGVEFYFEVEAAED